MRELQTRKYFNCDTNAFTWKIILIVANVALSSLLFLCPRQIDKISAGCSKSEKKGTKKYNHSELNVNRPKYRNALLNSFCCSSAFGYGIWMYAIPSVHVCLQNTFCVRNCMGEYARAITITNAYRRRACMYVWKCVRVWVCVRVFIDVFMNIISIAHFAFVNSSLCVRVALCYIHVVCAMCMQRETHSSIRKMAKGIHSMQTNE